MQRVLAGGLPFVVLLTGCAVNAEKAPENAPAVEVDPNRLPRSRRRRAEA